MFVLELLPSRNVLSFNTRFNVKMKRLIEIKLYMDGSLKHLKKTWIPMQKNSRWTSTEDIRHNGKMKL